MINIKKSKYIIIASPHNLKNILHELITLSMKGKYLDRVCTSDYLKPI